jgi:ankyrin repeat protein
MDVIWGMSVEGYLEMSVMSFKANVTLIPWGRCRVLAPLLAGLLLLPSVLWAGDLHDAVRNKDIAAVKALLADGSDVDETDYVLGTALHIAVLDGSEEIARILIRKGADVDAASELQDNRPLHLAAEFGGASMLALLLDNGATVDARNDIQKTPLMNAAVAANVEAVRLLLDRGADFEAREEGHEDTPLIAASFRGHLDIVKLLIANGADIQATNREGRTAFRVAATPASYGRVGGAALLEYLASQGADVNARDDTGFSALDFAEYRATEAEFIWAGIIKTVRRLGLRNSN